MPYEVRGGIALHSGKLWRFIQAMIQLEQSVFGERIGRYGIEIKGHRLLDKDKLRWANQGPRTEDADRRERCRSFISKSQSQLAITKPEFTAYGQSCLLMAQGIFDLLEKHDARVFATIIPRDAAPPVARDASEFLRKDHVFLFERYFYFLESSREHGLIVMDESEKQEDRRFVRKMEAYFTQTDNGRFRASRIIPSPFFVASDLTYPIQAADVVIYCVNAGYRVCAGMDEEARPEIQSIFEPLLQRLQYRGDFTTSEGTRHVYGITFVPDPYSSRRP